MLIITLFMLLLSSVFGQYQLDIAGHAKIEGRLELNADLQNVFIGQNTGILNSSGTANVLLGINSGASNSSGHSNVFIGETSGEKNFSGFHNVFIGRHAGRSNVLGVSNVFIGRSAGNNFNPLTGVGNNVIVGTDAGVLGESYTESTIVGFFSGNNNQGSQNSFFGANSGSVNTGDRNTYVGFRSGDISGSGSHNTYLGYRAGGDNDAGQDNTLLGSEAGAMTALGGTNEGNIYVGRQAGYRSTGGTRNISIGFQSGFGSLLGSDNIMIGSYTGASEQCSRCVLVGASAGTFGFVIDNSVALGNTAVVDASNKIRLGNESISVIEGQVPFSPASDRRLKKNIKSTTIGLDLINLLRPVTYNWKNGNEGKLFTGLIAQEVEEAASSLDYDFSAVVQPQSELGHYSLRYSDLVVPLINAVQTLSEQNDELVKEIKSLKDILIAELDDH